MFLEKLVWSPVLEIYTNNNHASVDLDNGIPTGIGLICVELEYGIPAGIGVICVELEYGIPAGIGVICVELKYVFYTLMLCYI